MRKLLFILFLFAQLLFVTNSNAQPSIIITPPMADLKRSVIETPKADSLDKIKFLIKDSNGVFEAKGSENFYVIEYKGKSASELYTNVLSSISTLYKNPERVLSKVDNVSIKVSATALDVPVPRDAEDINNVFPQKNDYFAFDYTLSFQFKDGKIRINPPSLDTDKILYANPIDGGRYGAVAPSFKHHFGYSSKYKIAFEKYLNELIVTILKNAEKVNNW